MRKINYLILLTVFVGATFSCKKIIDKLLTFSFDTSSTITIPGTSPINGVFPPLTLITPEMSASSSSEFGDNGTKVDLVKDAKLKKAVLTIISPEGQTFSFLNEIKISIQADGLPDVLVTSKTNIPSTEDGQIELDVEDVQLDDYIKKDKFTLKVDVVTDENVSDDTDVRADMTFQVTADPI